MNINKAIQSALEHFQSGDLKQAEHICRKTLEKQANNIDALHILGVICCQNRQYDFAITYIKRALLLDPNFADAYNNLGNIYQVKGQLDEAIACYRKTIQLNPRSAKTYYNLGVVLQDKGQVDEAINCYRKGMSLNLCSFGLYNNLGLALQGKGRVDNAMACYQSALKLNPNSSEAYNNLGTAFQVKGQLDEAIIYYQKAVELDQNYTDAYCNLGMSLVEKGKIDEAIKCYQKAMQIKPDFAWAHINMGIALDFKGQTEEAKLYFGQAFQLIPNLSSQSEELVNILRDKWKLQEVMSSYEKAGQKSILISVPAFNRKKVTQLSLAQIQRYKTSYCHLQVYNDHSTEYDNSFLMTCADEVIQLPHKMGIDDLRWYQFRKFLETDFDLIYMTDNDAIHDPQFITALEVLYEMGNRELPVSLFNSIFHLNPKVILYYKDEIMLKKTAPGISMLFDKKMVEKIITTSYKDDNSLHHLPWDNKAVAFLGLPWLTPQTSYLEHYGAYGINNDNYERDRAIFVTQYLREKRDSILKYLIQDIKLEIKF
jgi:tetratricopeptide (TPR) repeat protein